MPNRFNWNGQEDKLRLKLDSIIDLRIDDTLKNHLRQIILFKDEGKINGVVNQSNFKIWLHEQGRLGATGIFYPVIVGYFTTSANSVRVQLASKMNVVGRIAVVGIAMLFMYGLITSIVIQENNDLQFLIPRILIASIIFCLMMSLPAFVYFRTSRILKAYLIQELGLVIVSGTPRSTSGNHPPT